MTVQTTILANGLAVVTDRMDTVETVSLGAWVRVGTRYEAADINGVSHMLEHMAFKGTMRRDALAIAEEIEAVGGHLNAYTSRDMTAYHATILKEDVALAIDIIADILRNSVFNDDELARERAVVLQEIGQAADTPDDVVFDLFQDAAYPEQPMGRPVLGPPDIVGAMSRETLVEYMNTHYTAPRMVFAAAGKLDHDVVAGLVEQHFGTVVQGSNSHPEAARYTGGEECSIRDLEQVHLVLGFDGCGYHDPDFYSMGIAATILGGGMSSRLFQEIREKQGLAYSIYSFTSPYNDGGLFGVYAGTGAESVDALYQSLCTELWSAADNINERELARAKAQIRAGIVMSLESTASRAEQIARHQTVYDRIIPIEEMIEQVEAVDTEAVQKSITRLLASTPTLSSVGPARPGESFESLTSRLGRVA
jgi:predicted Zn-dependent peptidase